MKKLFLLFTMTLLFISCTSSTSKIETAVKKLNPKIERVENIEITEEYADSFRSPSDKGTTYKFSATYIYTDGSRKNVQEGVFIADKDGMAKWK